MPERPESGALIVYPCDYIFKAFGPSTLALDFRQSVINAVQTVRAVSQDAVQERKSSGGAYQCVSVLVRLHNEDDRRRIYAALHQIDDLKFLL